MKRIKKMNNKGFSLVELIIVIAIMAILAVVLVPAFIRFVGQSRVSNDVSNADMINDAVTAMITEDATDPATNFDAAPYSTTANNGFTIDANTAAITQTDLVAAMGGDVPEVSVDGNYFFVVAANADGAVTVSVSNGTNTYVLSPYDATTLSGTPWEN